MEGQGNGLLYIRVWSFLSVNSQINFEFLKIGDYLQKQLEFLKGYNNLIFCFPQTRWKKAERQHLLNLKSIVCVQRQKYKTVTVQIPMDPTVYPLQPPAFELQ